MLFFNSLPFSFCHFESSLNLVVFSCSSWGQLLQNWNCTYWCQGQQRESGDDPRWTSSSTNYSGTVGEAPTCVQERGHSHCRQCFSKYHSALLMTKPFLIFIMYSLSEVYIPGHECDGSIGLWMISLKCCFFVCFFFLLWQNNWLYNVHL